MFGDTIPNKSQASTFGLIDIDLYVAASAEDSSVHWTDGFKNELKLAWHWMPWSDTSGAQSAITSTDENNLQQTLDSDTFLQDLSLEIGSLDGNEAHEKANQYATDDKKKGAYASTVRQMIQTVDVNIHRKLQYYYMNQDLASSTEIKDVVI